jgi:putative hydrolase
MSHMKAWSFNRSAADLLRQCAVLLESQGANPFRVNAYRRAAQTIESLQTDVRALARERGVVGLASLPFVGVGLAQAINEIAKTGRLARLDRLRGAADPETLLQTVPGIGPATARTLHESLGVDTLEDLELAAYDGRLEKTAGIGTRRAAAIRASVAAMLGRADARGAQTSDFAPPVETLLDIDREYRARAYERTLPLLTPRRFNPKQEAWLPVLHGIRGNLHFTTLYSNTAKAHELGRTHDWVVIYFYDGDHREGRHTVVTETHGPLAGRRVVRGREAECADHYGVPAYSPAVNAG